MIADRGDLGAGMTSYYLADGLGSTTQLTDSAGAITDSYSYDVFGAPRTVTGTTANDFRYTGQQDDRNANRGLYFLRARSYDPALGRFLQKDPLPFINRYSYVANNPTNWIDPSGMCKKNWSILDKLDCPKEGLRWATDYAKSPWNQAQFVQNVGYTLAFTCETGFGCALAGTFVTWSWQQKMHLICDEIKAGKLTVKEGSKQFVLSLVPTPPGTPPVITGAIGNLILNKAVGRVLFEPLPNCT